MVVNKSLTKVARLERNESYFTVVVTRVYMGRPYRSDFTPTLDSRRADNQVHAETTEDDFAMAEDESVPPPVAE